MSKGGNFPAFDQPDKLARDIVKFMNKVEDIDSNVKSNDKMKALESNVKSKEEYEILYVCLLYTSPSPRDS